MKRHHLAALSIASIGAVATLVAAVVPSAPPAPDGAVRETAVQVEVHWRYELTPGEIGVLSIEDDAGTMTGEVHGCAAALRGERSVPLDPESRMATAEILIQNLPGPPGHVLQTEVFTYFGVRLGSVETHWYER